VIWAACPRVTQASVAESGWLFEATAGDDLGEIPVPKDVTLSINDVSMAFAISKRARRSLNFDHATTCWRKNCPTIRVIGRTRLETH
jgi:hypothetical protein